MGNSIGYKNGRFSIKKHDVQKSAAETAALRKLRFFLDKSEPALVRLLVTTWRSQGKAITYKELREAILAGEISAEYFEQWQEDYARFVTAYLQPMWEKSIDAAVAELSAKYPLWHFDPMAEGVREWAQTRAAEFVTNTSTTQIMGLRAVVQRAAALEDMVVDELARVIRPMVGLTKQQAIANMNYYETLIAGGMKTEKAMDLAIRYAARQHRYRAYNIARTELAFAYNKGSYEGIKQAQAAGYMGEMVKVWCTADDERVCEICGGMEGKRIAMDEDFDYKTRLQAANPGIRRTPPAHPGCRCTVIYEEISPPIFR